jgi:serine/threonine-protein kinase
VTIEPGRQLLHYRLIEKIGEGGMGVVWKAVDTTLDRGVAIKILPDLFTQDPERLGRFEREAKLLASLNHANIATLHGLQQAGDTRFLVMELVEGEDLLERIQRGPIPVEEALPIAVQLAEGLESAHEGGVIHRDLKPANVKLTAEGNVKILDFGLAKAFEPASDSSDPGMSPTLTSAGTQVGVILGTAAYMSPEQAKGRAVDRRADIWAFGVVLHEMLTGRPMFTGESVSEVLAAVLMTEPDPDRLPADTPPRVRRLIERCLRRDPLSRLRDIGDARIVLAEALAGREWTTAGAPSAETARSRGTFVQAVPWLAAGLVLGAAAVWLVAGGGGTPSKEVFNLAIPLQPTLRLQDHPPPTLTPDGKAAVFEAVDFDPEADDREPRLYVRRLDGDATVEVEGSRGVSAWALSPDGRWVVYATPVAEGATRRELVRVPLDRSAPPQKIADWPEEADDLFVWSEADRILLFRLGDMATIPVSVSDGSVGPPVETQEAVSGDFEALGSLDGGRYVLAHAPSFETGEYQQNAILLDTENGSVKRLVDHASHPVFSPTGHLLFTRGDTLLAAPFDRDRLEVTGGARTVARGIWSSGAYTGGSVDVSPDGHLLYPAGEVQGTNRDLVIVGRNGTTTQWSDEKLEYNRVSVSPDGRRVAVQVDNVGQGDALLEIRVSSLDRSRFVTLVSMQGRDCTEPTWSADSRRLAYRCTGSDVQEVYATTDGLEPRPDPVFRVPAPKQLRLIGFLPGETHLLAWIFQEDGTGELVSVALGSAQAPGDAGRRVPVEETRLDNRLLTPDGRWLVYSTSRSGSRSEFFVRRVESAESLGPRVAASVVGDLVAWSKTVRNGSYELLFERDSRLHVVEFAAGPDPTFGEPVVLDVDLAVLDFADMDLLPDGRLMMIRMPDSERGAAELRLVLNWTRDLAGRFE